LNRTDHGTTIVRRVEPPEHMTALSEGLRVRNYRGSGDRANFHDGETIRLFQDFGDRPASGAKRCPWLRRRPPDRTEYYPIASIARRPVRQPGRADTDIFS
jgi:hypothetical protein